MAERPAGGALFQHQRHSDHHDAVDSVPHQRRRRSEQHPDEFHRHHVGQRLAGGSAQQRDDERRHGEDVCRVGLPVHGCGRPCPRFHHGQQLDSGERRYADGGPRLRRGGRYERDDDHGGTDRVADLHPEYERERRGPQHVRLQGQRRGKWHGDGDHEYQRHGDQRRAGGSGQQRDDERRHDQDIRHF